MPNSPFAVDVTPDWEALVRCIRREGTPRRVHNIELFLDGEVQQAVAIATTCSMVSISMIPISI